MSELILTNDESIALELNEVKDTKMMLASSVTLQFLI